MTAHGVAALVLGTVSLVGSVATLLHYRSRERAVRNRLHVVTCLILCELAVQIKFVASAIQGLIEPGGQVSDESCRAMALADQFFAVGGECWYWFVLLYLYFAIRSMRVPPVWAQHLGVWGYAGLASVLPSVYNSYGRDTGEMFGAECWVLNEFAWFFYGVFWFNVICLIYVGRELQRSKMFFTSLNEPHVWRLVVYLVASILMQLLSSVLFVVEVNTVEFGWVSLVAYGSKGTVTSIVWFVDPCFFRNRRQAGVEVGYCCYCCPYLAKIEAIDIDKYGDGNCRYGTIGSDSPPEIKQQYSEEPISDFARKKIRQQFQGDDSMAVGDARVSFDASVA